MHSDAILRDAGGPRDAVEGTGLWQTIKRELPLRFGHEQLTSYGGLELLRRYFQVIGLPARLRQALAGHQVGGDYGSAHLVMLVVGLLASVRAVCGTCVTCKTRYSTCQTVWGQIDTHGLKMMAWP